MASSIAPEEAEAVLARYDVGRIVGLAPGGGTANASLRVRTERGEWFLKRRNPKYADPAFVAFDHRLMEHLAPFGVGTPLAVVGRDGARWTTDGASVYELYPFHAGEPFDPDSTAQIAGAGRALAAYHAATRAFVPPPGKAWPRYQDPARIREGWDAMAGELATLLPPDDLRYLGGQIAALETGYPDSRYGALPRLVVHGDYHPGNVLTDGDRVCGIYDLDWATVQPRVLDLADGVFLFAGRRASPIDASDIVSLTQTWTPDLPRWRAFVDAYLETETVADAEWEALIPTVRARWLFCRIGGRVKLPAERQAAFVADGLVGPLRALDAIGEEAWRRP